MDNGNTVPDIIIFDSKEDEYYRTINLVAMLMDDLSWKAKGLHYYIRTRPKGWKIWINDLINKSTDGETSVRAGIKELLENKKWMTMAFMVLIFWFLNSQAITIRLEALLR